MSAPAAVPVAISIRPDVAADRVLYQFGDQIYALPVEDAVALMSHTMAAVEILRPKPAAADPVVQ